MQTTQSCPLIPIALMLAMGLEIGSAAANDFAVGGVPSDLHPLAQTEVWMQSETITIMQSETDLTEFHVVANYVFATESSTEQAVTLGFPEYACPELAGGDCRDRGYADMQTRAGGELLPNTIGELDESLALSEEFGTIWVYDVVVPAQSILEVEHRYSFHTAGGGDGVVLGYITTSGALWSRPIERAEFQVWFQHPIDWAIVPSSWGPPIETRGDPNADGGPTTSLGFSWVHEDWVPTQDLVVRHDSRWLNWFPRTCPPIRDIVIGAAEGLSADEMAESEIVNGTSAALASLCQSLPHALHGASFRDPEIVSALYSGCSFRVDEHTLCWAPAPSTSYSPASLGADELLYIEVMEATEHLLTEPQPQARID